MRGKIASGMMLMVLLTSMLSLAFSVQSASASGTIYIRSDGSVEGTDKVQQNGDIYTFANNIYDSIVVERDNIVVDGAGYTIEGDGEGTGIDLSGRSNVTIKNMEIKTFDYGIRVKNCSNNSIYHNNFINNTQQVDGDSSENIWDNGYPSCGNYWSDCIPPLWKCNLEETPTIVPPFDSVYGSTENLLEISNERAHSGIHSAKHVIVSPRHSATYTKVVSATPTLHARVYLYLESLVGESGYARTIALEMHGPRGVILYLGITNDLRLRYYYRSIVDGNEIFSYKTSTTSLSLGRWYSIELRIDVGTTTGAVHIWLNGVPIDDLTLTGINNTGAGLDIIEASGGIRALDWDATIHTDDFAVSDSYIGPVDVEDLWSGPSQDESDSDGIWDHPYVLNSENQDNYPLVNPWTPPAIVSCDIFGIERHTFNPAEDVYVKGSGYLASRAVGIYIVPDGNDPTPENAKTFTSKTTETDGTLVITLVGIARALDFGKYNIWVDVNLNEIFDEGDVDVLNDQAIDVFAFYVTPEPAIIVSVLLMFGGFVVFYWREKRKLHGKR